MGRTGRVLVAGSLLAAAVATLSARPGTAATPAGGPAIAVSDPAVLEGTATGSTATFVVSLASASSQAVSVQAATADNTAKAGTDYRATTTTVTFAPGQTSQTVAVAVLPDALKEANESFLLKLSAPVGGTLADTQGQATILDDESARTVGVDDPTVVEGASGSSTEAVFHVSLDAPVGAGQSASVRVATKNGTSTAGTDYTAVPSTTLAFGPGQQTKAVSVTVNGDSVKEADETILLNLTSPTGAVLGDTQGTATIRDDDALPMLSVGDPVVVEGPAGSTTSASFTLRLSAPATAGQSASVRVATATGSKAVAGTDYVALASTTVTFAADATTATVPVAVLGDGASEGNETFLLKLSSPVGAVLADSQGTATIVDDDRALVTPPPWIGIDDPRVQEGTDGTSNAVFTLQLDRPAPATTSVVVATKDGSALAGSDYTGRAASPVTFAAGQTTALVTVPITPDAAKEASETFTLALSSPVGLALADTSGQATIVNDDVALFAHVDDPTVVEGGPGTSTTATFTVSLSEPPHAGQVASVVVGTADGTALAGQDFAAVAPTTVTFGAGERSRAVAVTVTGDADREAAETLRLTLTAPVGVSVADASGQATILDDDGPNWVYVDDPVLAESDAAHAIVFHVTLAAPPGVGQAVSVDVATANGTATAGSDYTATSSTVRFTFGQQSASVTVPVLTDSVAEGDETFVLKLSKAVGTTIGDAAGTATIRDGLGTARLSFQDVTSTAGLSSLGSAYSHAAAWGDVDGDGRPDLFVGTFTTSARTDGQTPSPNRLFLNTPSGFVDAGQPVVERSGRASGGVLADLDGDGDLDLVVSNNTVFKTGSTPNQLEPTRLYRNDAGHLVDVTDASGIDVADRNGRSVGVLDYDGDGRLDLFMVADSLTGTGTRVSRLLRNTGGLRFVDATAAAGLPTNLAGLGVAVGDANADGWPDLVTTGGVSASGQYANVYLFLNDRDGTFRDATDPAMAWPPHTNEDWTAGATFGDLNRDGRPDLVVTEHFETAPDFPVAPRIFLNQGNDSAGDPIFDELLGAGLAPIPSKAPQVDVVDMDNDGLPDVYVSVLLTTANGPAPYVYLQQSSTGTPTFLAPSGAVQSYAPGGPTADYDGDGRVDVFMEGFDVQVAPSLLRNVTTGTGHWLAVQVRSSTSNRFGVGARIAVYRSGQLGQAAGLLATAELGTGNGFSSASPIQAHLGLGSASSVDVAVTMPFGGPTVTRTAVPVDQVLTVAL